MFVKVHNENIYVMNSKDNEQLALIDLGSKVVLYYDQVSSQVKDLLEQYAQTGHGITSRMENNRFSC